MKGMALAVSSHPISILDCEHPAMPVSGLPRRPNCLSLPGHGSTTKEGLLEAFRSTGTGGT